jgi:hypothetical protein
MKEKLPCKQFSAVMFSLPTLTERVIEKKLLELEPRMQYVSIGAAIISAVPISYMHIIINSALIKSEVRHYVKVFGLDQTHNENIEGLKNDFSVVSVDSFTERKIIANYNACSSKRKAILLSTVLFRKSLLGGHEIRLFVYTVLSDVLSELQKDAITVYMHFLNKDHHR